MCAHLSGHEEKKSCFPEVNNAAHQWMPHHRMPHHPRAPYSGPAQNKHHVEFSKVAIESWVDAEV
jgi:hypothetical protein